MSKYTDIQDEVIQRWGHDDYEADWDESYSVRGTLKQILDEIKNEL